jgi:hypothetical protein
VPQQRDHGDSKQSARVRRTGGIIAAPAVCSEDGSNLKEFSAGIFKQSMGASNREGIGLHSQAELVPWNRFLGSLKFKNSGSGGTGAKRLQRPQCIAVAL